LSSYEPVVRGPAARILIGSNPTRCKNAKHWSPNLANLGTLQDHRPRRLRSVPLRLRKHGRTRHRAPLGGAKGRLELSLQRPNRHLVMTDVWRDTGKYSVPQHPPPHCSPASVPHRWGLASRNLKLFLTLAHLLLRLTTHQRSDSWVCTQAPLHFCPVRRIVLRANHDSIE